MQQLGWSDTLRALRVLWNSSKVPALGSRVTNMSQSTREILLGIVAYLAACLADTTGVVLLCGSYLCVCPIDVEHCRRLDGDVLHEEERGLARPLCPPVRAPTLDLNPRVRTMMRTTNSCMFESTWRFLKCRYGHAAALSSQVLMPLFLAGASGSRIMPGNISSHVSIYRSNPCTIDLASASSSTGFLYFWTIIMCNHQ